jgi:2-polyprenyl-3-methyl-5-hydroxy-6-metoxy-1,4-benzoquinol methylase
VSNIVRLVESRSSDRLAAEWDQLASHREELIASGRDLSYHHVLLPSLTELLGSLAAGGRVLDAGCSTGMFLSQLADEHSEVDFLGIDPSANSIGIARARRPDLANCDFRVMTVEQLAASSRGEFTAIIANMLLQNVASFGDVMAACASLLAPGGTFVFAVPHPVSGLGTGVTTASPGFATTVRPGSRFPTEPHSPWNPTCAPPTHIGR